MNVKILGICLMSIAILSLSSCATKVIEKPVRVEVPVRCEVPEIEKPNYLKPAEQDSATEILRKLLHNYAECRIYSERLEKALEVCR